MTLPVCEQVTERIALGESLGDLAEHAETCDRCQQVVEMSSKLAATRHDVDPGLGFSARMTVGAQHLIAVRRRRRLAVGLAATVASGAFGVFLVTRNPEVSQIVRTPAAEDVRRAPTADDEQLTEASDEDLAGLVDLADVKRSTRVSARWSHIKKPLAAYEKLLEDLEGDAP